MSLKDLKESLSSSRKADLTHVRQWFMRYGARSSELGCDKYVRANYLRPVNPPDTVGPTGKDFDRFRAYLRACVAHVTEVLDAMEKHQALDPQLVDVDGMKRAAYAVDLDVTPGAKVGASLLPHVAPAVSSLMMAIEQAILYGLLPADPGTPWRLDVAERAALLERVAPRAPLGFDVSDVKSTEDAPAIVESDEVQQARLAHAPGCPLRRYGNYAQCTCGVNRVSNTAVTKPKHAPGCVKRPCTCGADRAANTVVRREG